MRTPEQLTQPELVRILTEIQQILYLAPDGVYTRDKIPDLNLIHEVMAGQGLAPLPDHRPGPKQQRPRILHFHEIAHLLKTRTSVETRTEIDRLRMAGHPSKVLLYHYCSEAFVQTLPRVQDLPSYWTCPECELEGVIPTEIEPALIVDRDLSDQELISLFRGSASS